MKTSNPEVGQQFGKWTVLIDLGLKLSGKYRTKRFYLCLCECGAKKEVAMSHLKAGESKACRKCGKSSSKPFNRTEYTIWCGMKQRCCNPKSPDYKAYGKRGIKVCERWLNSFENFLNDMGNRPVNHSIDRINNDGNYEPSNCRWATPKIQQNNRRNSNPRKVA